MMSKKNKKLLVLIWAFALPAFLVSEVSFWRTAIFEVKAADDAGDIQNNISDVQKKIDKELKAKKLLEQNLGQIQGAVTSTVMEINKTQSVIKNTTDDISRKEAEIQNLNDKIELQKTVLAGLLREAYYNQSQPILNVVLTNANFAKAFSNTDHLTTVEDKIQNISAELAQTKSQIEGDKVELAQVKETHEDILDDKVDQKQELLADKAAVAADVAEKEATIGELQQKLAELQSDLNVLTGNSYDAKDINDAIAFASKKTDVPRGILFAFLTQESGRGKNVGQCTYKDVERVSVAGYKKYGKRYQNSINTLYKRWDLFKDIVNELGYSENKKVSCTIPFSSAGPNQGGAMGVAQFMSDTWTSTRYYPRVASLTGHKDPDPWNLTDGTMALALKVKDAGGTSISTSAIKKMVTTYYGASPDNNSVAKSYYSNVLYYVKNYDKLVNN